MEIKILRGPRSSSKHSGPRKQLKYHNAENVYYTPSHNRNPPELLNYPSFILFRVGIY